MMAELKMFTPMDHRKPVPIQPNPVITERQVSESEESEPESAETRAVTTIPQRRKTRKQLEHELAEYHRCSPALHAELIKMHARCDKMEAEVALQKNLLVAEKEIGKISAKLIAVYEY